jgi:hypothetical protein
VTFCDVVTFVASVVVTAVGGSVVVTPVGGLVVVTAVEGVGSVGSIEAVVDVGGFGVNGGAEEHWFPDLGLQELHQSSCLKQQYSEFWQHVGPL